MVMIENKPLGPEKSPTISVNSCFGQEKIENQLDGFHLSMALCNKTSALERGLWGRFSSNRSDIPEWGAPTLNSYLVTRVSSGTKVVFH